MPKRIWKPRERLLSKSTESLGWPNRLVGSEIKTCSLGWTPASEFRVITITQILTQNFLSREGTADAARALNEEARRNLERPASPVELPGFLWRPEVSEAAVARIEPERPQKRPHIDGSDDVVTG